jgi:hypothetical protein
MDRGDFREASPTRSRLFFLSVEFQGEAARIALRTVILTLEEI